MAKCVICNKRKGKRYCKSLGQWICTECCGEKRFKEINCPEDCIYLKRAQEYSIERVVEVIPPWEEDKLWSLHFNIELITYNFVKENPNFTDEEYKEVISLFEKEYETRLKNLFLPSLIPKSSRGAKLKVLLQEALDKFQRIENDFGLPLITTEDVVRILSWERERIEEYQRKNKNAGPDFFLQILKTYVEHFTSSQSKKASSIIYPY